MAAFPHAKVVATQVFGLIVFKFDHANPSLLQCRSIEERLQISLNGGGLNGTYTMKVLARVGIKDWMSVDAQTFVTKTTENRK